MKTKRIAAGTIARIENGVLHIISGGSEFIDIATGRTINPQWNVIHDSLLRERGIKWARKQIL